MLKKIRLTTAVIFYSLITLLFLDFTGTIHAWFGWLAKIQFIPALLALNVGVIIFLVVMTFLLGRVYCSVICPLGVFQDIVAWFSKKRKSKKLPYTYSKAKSWLRYSFLALFIGAFIAGLGSLFALLEPYSAYGRIANNLFQPIWLYANNLLAYFAERMDSYAFYEVDVWIKSIPTFIIAVITLIAIIILAWRNGRTYCNTICPVGTILGFVSKFSIFKPVISADKCNSCGLCARNCKSACIDSKNKTIDYSRCVTCFDCIEKCNKNALKYTRRRTQIKTEENVTTEEKLQKDDVDNSKRGFLSAVAVLATTATIKAQGKTVDGGLAVIENKVAPKRDVAIVPAGAKSHSNFYSSCTACQLCISVCPNKVLRPSSDLTKLMQPEVSYELGYCRPECTICSEVCPAGAIIEIDKAEKSSIQIGKAVWVKENCVVLTDEVECGNCARHCPVGAIQMVALEPDALESRKFPVINIEVCIGCGACENLCPSRPFSAIYVEGQLVHRTV